MAEREGFYYRQLPQVSVIPTVSDSSLCLCWFQAHSQLRVQFSTVSAIAFSSLQNGITGISALALYSRYGR